MYGIRFWSILDSWPKNRNHLVVNFCITSSCIIWCTRSYTGWTSLSESVTSWACWLTGVCSAKRQCTCPTVVSRSPRLQHVGICGLLHVITSSWPLRDIVSTLTVVGHSLLLVLWRSTLCQLICETPLSAQQLPDNCWKHTFSLPIRLFTFSALGVSHVMRYINLRYLPVSYTHLTLPTIYSV